MECMDKAALGPYGTPEKARPYPKMVRPQTGRVIAGVAGGVAQHLGVDVLVVRGTFIVLSLFSGFGAVLYAALWMFIPVAQGPAPRSRWEMPHGAHVGLAVLGVLAGLAGTVAMSGLSLPVLVPVAVVVLGALIAWLAYDRGLDSAMSGLSITLGSLLVLAGVVLSVLRWNGGQDFGPALLAVALTVVGLGALVVPLLLKLWRSLAQEQAGKAASEERAEIAARLHDSVLQTLALIQKRAQDPGEVVRLARAQERELRGWLFDAPAVAGPASAGRGSHGPTTSGPTSVFAALEAACGEVEDLFGVRISPVRVGEDAALSDATKLTVQAAREAMVNAGKHAGVETLDVYAENLGGQLSIFVRDRGVGFDPQAVPADRHGLKDSIQARMESVGGRARVRSAPGEGTEVEVTVAL